MEVCRDEITFPAWSNSTGKSRHKVLLPLAVLSVASSSERITTCLVLSAVLPTCVDDRFGLGVLMAYSQRGPGCDSMGGGGGGAVECCKVCFSLVKVPT
eukprot:1939466-Amphidinium_carterae.1